MHPHTKAQTLAAQLEEDLVATSQIKEILSPDRLLEILDIPEQTNEQRLDEIIETLNRNEIRDLRDELTEMLLAPRK